MKLRTTIKYFRPKWCSDCKFVTWKYMNVEIEKIISIEPFITEDAGRDTVPQLFCKKEKKFIPCGENPPYWCKLEDYKSNKGV